MSMDFQEIVSLALDEFNAAEDDAPSVNPPKPSVPGVKMPPSGPKAGAGNASQPPKNPTSPQDMQNNLSAHDEKYHKEGYKEGQTCKYRDKMAATARATGMLTPALKAQLGQTAVRNGSDAANAASGAEFDAFKAAQEKLNHINKATNADEHAAALKEFQEARDAYIKKAIGDAEYACVDGLKKIVAMGGDKAKLVVDKMKGIIEKFKGKPQEEAAKTVLEKAGVDTPESTETPEEIKEGAPESTAESTETTPENPESAPETTAAEETRYTEEGLNKRIDEIRKGLLEDGADVSKLMDEMRTLNKKLQDRDFDPPSKQDIDNKVVEAFRAVNDAKTAVDAAKSELEAARKDVDAAKTKAEKDAAEQKAADAEQKLNDAEQALQDAERDAKGAEFDALNYKESENSEKDKAENNGQEENPELEHQIGKKTYVDLDEIEKQKGWFASLGAAFKAGLEGKDIVTGWDKMSGRWDKIAGGAKTDKQKQGMSALQDEMAKQNFIRGLKRAAFTEDNPDLKDMYNNAVSLIENNGKVSDVVKYLDKRKGELVKQGQNAELHEVKKEKEMANAATAAAKAFAAEQANKEKYREQTVKESQPEVYNAIENELQEEVNLGDQADPTKVAALQNILKTLSEDKSVKNINNAIKEYGKGWSHKAKNDEAVKAIKAQNVQEDNLEKTWAESNAEGKLKDLDSAIETLGKRKDDAGKAAAARLTEIRKELGTSHSEKRTEALLKEWSGIVGGVNRKGTASKPTFDDPGAYDLHHENGGVLTSGKSVDENGEVQDTQSNDQAPDIDNVLTSRTGISNPEQRDEQQKLANIANILSVANVKNGVSKVGVNRTTFEFDADTLPSKAVLNNLVNSIENAVKSQNVSISSRYEDGKGKISVTIPNTTRGDVDFKTGLVGSPARKQAFEDAKKNMSLPCYVGDDEDGNPVYLDFKDMTHLLVGGETNMGKSVTMNSILASLMLARNPKQLKVVAIDGKGNEFDSLDGSAHNAVPVAKTKDQIIASLQWLNQEEKNRRALFAETKKKYGLSEIKNIYQYNEWAAKNGKEQIPEIVVPIDEMSYINDIPGAGDMVSNLARIARSSGIHLMVGTQHPTQENIGKCKQNMPARIGLHTTSTGADAIFDNKEGYEKADRPGALMIELPGKKIHAQGARMNDGDMEKINNHWKSGVNS